MPRTLDHLTKGRVGWNIVTSYLPNAARNFGLDGEVEHDNRFEIADEYLDVLYKLWEGSWDDDAIVADREHNVLRRPGEDPADRPRRHLLQGRGPAPALARAGSAPRCSSPPPQSAAGTEFAGKHAEVVFTGGPSEEFVKRTAAALKQAAVDAGRRGRRPQGHHHGGRHRGADRGGGARQARRASRSSPTRRATWPTPGCRGTRRPTRRDLPVDEVPDLADGRVGRFRQVEPGQTVGDFLAGFGDLARHPLFAVGTPEQVADEIEHWLDDVDIDGINLLQYHSYDTAKDFIELVVPVLRERGRLRSSYDESESLRDRIFGEGDRLPDRHYGTRYRGGAHLPVTQGPSPSPPLRPPPRPRPSSSSAPDHRKEGRR